MGSNPRFRGLKITFSIAIAVAMLAMTLNGASSLKVQDSVEPVLAFGADLSISASGLGVSNAAPAAGEAVTISAAVHGDISQPSGWQKRGVVLDLGGTGETLQVLSPSVLQLADGSYAMYYMASAVSGYNYRIYRATSPDGIVWQKQGMVIDKGGAYESACVYHPYVMLDEAGVYHMWYNGVNLEDGYRSRTMHAYSYDGITFVKTGLDMNFGSASDPAGVHNPYVLYDNGQYRMWYQGTYWTPCFNRICHADKGALTDPWVKDGTVLSNDGPYDSMHALRPWVMRTADGGYEMFYGGIDSSSVGRVLRATSQDGITWAKDGIVFGPTLAKEGTYIGYNSLIRDGDTYRMWYSGYDGLNWRIFYAENAPAEPALDAMCTVSFYLDCADSQNLIGSVENVFVPANGQATASVEWAAAAGNHTIIVQVEDVNPADDDLSNNAASAAVTVSAPSQAEMAIQKVKLSGIDEGSTLTYYEWELEISVSNIGGSVAREVEVRDVLPAELGLLQIQVSTGIVTTVGTSGSETRSLLPPPTIYPVKSTHITWIIGEMQPGTTETLNMRICTRVNPGGNQEFTSAGTYSLNDGAWLCALDSLTGGNICEGPTPSITVFITDLVTEAVAIAMDPQTIEAVALPPKHQPSMLLSRLQNMII